MANFTLTLTKQEIKILHEASTLLHEQLLDVVGYGPKSAAKEAYLKLEAVKSLHDKVIHIDVDLVLGTK